MSISVVMARQLVADAPTYRNSASWKERVLRMPANQVLAIYHSLKARGEFDIKPKSKKEVEPAEPEYRQMTLFDSELGGLRLIR